MTIKTQIRFNIIRPHMTYKKFRVIWTFCTKQYLHQRKCVKP